ncbi:hypothetical protein BX600DRAFT_441681 [Xylariales sp. PMI_506]|nr:hypothetical protein BX600DRAFT_441681 [Xylariales sp. PMI_506]
MASIQSLAALRPMLSAGATVDTPTDSNYAISAARWSDLSTPKPGAVINVACEGDIEAAVKWATDNNVPFVAQSGGHAWSTSLKINSSGVVINMRKLNSISIDTEKGLAVIGGGITVKEAMAVAKAHKVHLAVGTCNTVGVIPAMVGGGTGNLMGELGLGADNMVSARIVTADGIAKTVSATENTDLWWAVRGAGHNFGVISTVTIKTSPQLNEGMHYQALLIFPPMKIEDVVQSVTTLEMVSTLVIDILFLRAPPDFQHAVAVSVWHGGSEESAQKLIAPILDLSPIVAASGMVPYDHTNDGLDYLCFTGGFKPIWGVSIDEVKPEVLKEFWDTYVTYSSNEDTKLSVVNLQRYSMSKVNATPIDSNAVSPGLRKNFFAFFAGIYSNPSRHEVTREVGEKFRNVMNGGEHNPLLYPNLATGDETVEKLYGDGEKLEKLRRLKKQYDPNNVFSHYIPIH